MVMTFNTQQSNAEDGEKSYTEQLALIRRVSPDILALQESDSARISLNNNDYVRYFAENLGYYSYYGPTPVIGSYGTAILSKYPLKNTRTAFIYSDKDETAIAEAELEVAGRTFTIYDVHPDSSDPAMLAFAKTLLERSKGKPYVIALGDYNLRDYEEAYQLIDGVLSNAWTSVYPSEIGADGVDMSGENRIDHIFLSPDLPPATRSTSCRRNRPPITPCTGRKSPGSSPRQGRAYIVDTVLVQPAARSGYRWWILSLGTLTNALVVALQSMCLPVLFKEISVDLDLTLVQIGLVWGISALPGMFSTLVGGALGDRFGPRHVLVLSCLATGLAGGLRGTAFDFNSLLLTMVLFGMIAPIVGNNVFKIVGGWMPQKQMGFASGVLSMGMALGFLVGAMLSATVLSPLLGNWRNVLFLYGGIAMILSVPWIFSRQAPQISAHSVASGGRKGHAP